MIVGIDLNETENYTCKKDIENPTIWKLGVLDSITMAQIDDLSTTFELPELAASQPKTTLNIKARNVEVVKFGLKGWSNFKDNKGNDIAYKTKQASRGGKQYTVVSDDIVSIIPSDVINELSEAIVKKNVLSIDEIKN